MAKKTANIAQMLEDAGKGVAEYRRTADAISGIVNGKPLYHYVKRFVDGYINDRNFNPREFYNANGIAGVFQFAIIVWLMCRYSVPMQRKLLPSVIGVNFLEIAPFHYHQTGIVIENVYNIDAEFSADPDRANLGVTTVVDLMTEKAKVQ